MSGRLDSQWSLEEMIKREWWAAGLETGDKVLLGEKQFQEVGQREGEGARTHADILPTSR